MGDDDRVERGASAAPAKTAAGAGEPGTGARRGRAVGPARGDPLPPTTPAGGRRPALPRRPPGGERGDRDGHRRRHREDPSVPRKDGHRSRPRRPGGGPDRGADPMNDTELKDRLSAATEPAVAATDLARLQRPARTIRLRRGLAPAIAATLGIAAIALPLSGLRHLGQASPSQPAAGPRAISFAPLEGWTASTATSPAFAPFGQPASAATITN